MGEKTSCLKMFSRLYCKGEHNHSQTESVSLTSIPEDYWTFRYKQRLFKLKESKRNQHHEKSNDELWGNFRQTHVYVNEGPK